MKSLVGKNLKNGKYILKQKIGEGGCGCTYKAIDRINNRIVVIKTFKSDLALQTNSSNIRKKFLNEAQRLIKCYHPNIVQFYEFFSENGFPYIVIDYIPGKTLDTIVFPNNPLPEVLALRYIQQIGEALKVVHERGLLHRDVKPNNLILRQDLQQVVLIDFGIAREFSGGLVQTHTNLVSDGYAPIEQYLPKAKRTPSTDIYGLAATLYTLLTAQIPISATLRNRLTLDAPQKIRPELSDRISQAVMEGMALELEERPGSIDEWLALLPQIDSNISSMSVATVISLKPTKQLTKSKQDPSGQGRERFTKSTVVSQVKRSSYSKKILTGLIASMGIIWSLDYAWLRLQALSQNEQIKLNSTEKPQQLFPKTNNPNSSSSTRIPSIFVSPNESNRRIEPTTSDLQNNTISDSHQRENKPIRQRLTGTFDEDD